MPETTLKGCLHTVLISSNLVKLVCRICLVGLVYLVCLVYFVYLADWSILVDLRLSIPLREGDVVD